MHTVRVAPIVLILVSLLAGCVFGQPQHQADKAQPTPPAELQSLPRRAQGIMCAMDAKSNDGGTVDLGTAWHQAVGFRTVRIKATGEDNLVSSKGVPR